MWVVLCIKHVCNIRCEESLIPGFSRSQNVNKEDIVLTHLMDFTYYFDECFLEVYVGKLKQSKTVSGDENDLYWVTLGQDFFDDEKYAGEGNIGHIMKHINRYKKELRI